ncbi:MAG: septum formation initiator family protein [Bacteroidetes bacterium]|nr:septum formation initiator family protein [Bacteroidota bacterium]
MKIFKYTFKFFLNKYILTVLILAGWLLFFDKNDVFSQVDRHREVMKLQAESDYFRNEILRNKKEQHELQSDPALLEKFARENYFMKRDSEDVFVIVGDTVR